MRWPTSARLTTLRFTDLSAPLNTLSLFLSPCLLNVSLDACRLAIRWPTVSSTYTRPFQRRNTCSVLLGRDSSERIAFRIVGDRFISDTDSFVYPRRCSGRASKATDDLSARSSSIRGETRDEEKNGRWGGREGFAYESRTGRRCVGSRSLISS